MIKSKPLLEYFHVIVYAPKDIDSSHVEGVHYVLYLNLLQFYHTLFIIYISKIITFQSAILIYEQLQITNHLSRSHLSEECNLYTKQFNP